MFFDVEGLIRYWSHGATRIFGFTADEALGESLDIIIPRPLRDRHWKGFQRAVRVGESRYAEGILLSTPASTKDGRKISIQFSIAMLRGSHDAVTGVAGYLRDVTTEFEEIKRLRSIAAGSASPPA